MGKWGEIARKAAGQGGFITREQLFDLGVSKGSLWRKLEAGDLTVVSDGVYQVFPPGAHIDLMRGAFLALPTAIVSHQSAAHLLELDKAPELIPTVTVSSHTTHRFPGVLVRRSNDLALTHLTEIDGLGVTTVARTVFDLAAVVEFREFERVAEAALMSGRLHLQHLDGLVAELARRGKPGVRAVRDFLDLRSGGPDDASVLERLGRKVLASGGLPETRPEFPIPWRQWQRFDDAYPDARLAIEWDSRGWHTQQEMFDSDRHRDRDAASHGWLIIRFTWSDVTKHPEDVVSAVAKLLKQRRSAA